MKRFRLSILVTIVGSFALSLGLGMFLERLTKPNKRG